MDPVCRLTPPKLAIQVATFRGARASVGQVATDAAGDTAGQQELQAGEGEKPQQRATLLLLPAPLPRLHAKPPSAPQISM